MPPAENNVEEIKTVPPVSAEPQLPPDAASPQTQWGAFSTFFSQIERWWLLAGLIIVGALIAGGYYFFLGTETISPPFGLQPEKKEYLIGGVPYWGSYRGTELTTSPAFVAYTLLQYWGDDRFTPQEVARLFPVANAFEERPDADLVSFFEENGYLVRSQAIAKIADLFPFVSADMPVVLALRAAPDAPDITTSLRVVIGYSTERETLMVHDNLFGNNYEWSFDDIEAMMKGKPRAALLVTPGVELAKTIAGPNHGVPYPPRLSIMDDLGMQEIQVKWHIISALNWLYTEKRVSTAGAIVKLWEEILANPSFGKLHPAARMLASYNLAKMYTNNLKEHQKAIDTLKTVTIPLLSIDFSKPFGEWERNNPGVYDDPSWKTKPRVLLGAAYARLGNKVEAEKAYRAALAVNPGDEEAKRLLELLLAPAASQGNG